jgi:hypothetical protein
MNTTNHDKHDITGKARAIKEAYQSELMLKANVVGLGIGYRHKNGKPTQEIALIVLVNQKLPLSALGERDLLPEQIEGITVDVQEVGDVIAY